MVEIILNNVNFVIVYVSVLFTIMGILMAFGSRELNKVAVVRKEIEREIEDLKEVKDTIRENLSLEAQLTTAKIFFIQRDFIEAWENIKNLPDDFNYEVPLYKARILINKERSVFSTVMTLLDKALSFPDLTNESRAIIYRYMAFAHKRKKWFKESLEYAEKAIVENRIYWPAHNQKAIALRHLGRMEEAIKTLEEIIEEDKSYSYAHYNLACYHSLKSVKEPNLKEKAVNYYKEAIRLNSRFKESAKTDNDLDAIRNEIENL